MTDGKRLAALLFNITPRLLVCKSRKNYYTATTPVSFRYRASHIVLFQNHEDIRANRVLCRCPFSAKGLHMWLLLTRCSLNPSARVPPVPGISLLLHEETVACVCATCMHTIFLNLPRMFPRPCLQRDTFASGKVELRAQDPSGYDRGVRLPYEVVQADETCLVCLVPAEEVPPGHTVFASVSVSGISSG